MYGPVAALDKGVLEPALVQPLDAFFAAVARPEEFDVRVWVVCKHVHYFVVKALVEIVAILEVDLAYFRLVWDASVSTLPLGLLSSPDSGNTDQPHVKLPFAGPQPAS